MSTTATTTPAVQQSAKPVPARKTFQDWFNDDTVKIQLQNALPKHLTPDRFIRVLFTATLKNPKLLECTKESIFKGVFDAAAAGLEIDGRRAHLVPYANNKRNCVEAQLIIDYKGLAELAMRSGVVSNIHADLICENDVFEYDRGLIVKHVIDFRKPRGKPYAAYCLIRMKDGGEKAEVMNEDEIHAIKSRSRSANNGPWITDPGEMWKKTVARRAFKWVPLSPEIREAIEKDDDDFDHAKNVTPKPSLSTLLSGEPGLDHVEASSVTADTQAETLSGSAA